MESLKLVVNETLLHLCDLHIPDHDQRSVTNVLSYAKDFKPNTVLLNGDVLDCASISSHVKGNLRAIEGKTLRKEYDEGERFLEKLRAACPESRIIWMEGNHEYRVQRWLDEHPQAQGLLEVPNGMNFNSWKIEWVPSWSQTKVFKKGKANFIHGLYTGSNHAGKMVKAFGGNVFYGHCVSMDTEVLTDRGFKNLIELKPTDKIASVDKDYSVVFDHYEGTVEGMTTSEFVNIKARGVDILCDPEHQIITNKLDNKVSAKDVKGSFKVFHGGFDRRDGIDLYEEELQLIVWIAADGSLENSQNAVRWHLKKPRKIIRLKQVLEANNVEYTETISSTGSTKIYANLKSTHRVKKLFTWGDKKLPQILFDCNVEQAYTILEEYIVTDGCKTGPGSYQICSMREEEIDLLQAVFCKSGLRTSKTKTKLGAFVLSISDHRYVTMNAIKSVKTISLEEPVKVWCVKTKLGNIITRRNGKTALIGNCHDCDSASLVTIGDHTTKVAHSLGCLCKYKQSYLKGRPTNWQQAFATFHFRDDGYFNYNVTKIFNGKFVSPEGECYG